MSKNTKLIDLTKFFRRIKYRVQNQIQYKLLVNHKHLLLLGGQNHPLTPNIVKMFSNNWKICHIDQQPIECDLPLSIQDPELRDKVRLFSKHYEAILYLPSFSPLPQEPIENLMFQKKEIEKAYLVAHFAAKHLTNNGFVSYFVNENSFKNPPAKHNQTMLMESTIQSLAITLAEREDLENDAVVYLFLQNELMFEKSNESLKFLKSWVDGMKRPGSGTYIEFKMSTHQTPVLYPELI